MATAFVSGAAALVRKQQPAASVAELAAHLSTHTVNLDKQNPTFHDQLGGLLDIGAALQSGGAPTPTAPSATSSPTPTPVVTPTPPTTVGQDRLYLPLIAGK